MEMGTIAAAAAGTADSAVSLCPEIRAVAAVIQADRMDIRVIPAAVGRIRTAAVQTAIHGIQTAAPAIPIAGLTAGRGVMW